MKARPGALAAGLLCLAAAIWLLMRLGVTEAFDAALMEVVGASRGSAAARFAAGLGAATGFVPRTVAVGFVALLLAVRGQGKAAMLLLAVVLGGALAVTLLKIGIDRARPDLALRLAPTSGTSFPSGHAANAMTVGLALALIVARPRWRSYAIAAGLGFAFLVGLSRVMLWVHWPSDVLAGWCFGAGWVLALTAQAAPRRSPRGSP